MQIVSNMNVLRTIAANNDEGLSESQLLTRPLLISYWKKTHVYRVQQAIRKLLRLGWIWVDEKGKHYITDLGKARI
jgi:hypothetical protein